MEYATPELVVVGRAEELVLGAPEGANDHIGSLVTQPDCGIALGLDE
jgi:hypothetical protein